MKCPSCGYDPENKYNPSIKIRELRNQRSRHTKKLLYKTTNHIMATIPSDNKILHEYYFYQSISKIDDETIEYIISGYLKKQTYLLGKGFKYLSAMITNHKRNRDVISKNETLMRGKPPSRVKIKEN